MERPIVMRHNPQLFFSLLPPSRISSCCLLHHKAHYSFGTYVSSIIFYFTFRSCYFGGLRWSELLSVSGSLLYCDFAFAHFQYLHLVRVSLVSVVIVLSLLFFSDFFLLQVKRSTIIFRPPRIPYCIHPLVMTMRLARLFLLYFFNSSLTSLRNRNDPNGRIRLMVVLIKAFYQKESFDRVG